MNLPAHLQMSFCLRGEEFSQGHGPGNPALLQSLPQEDAGLDLIWRWEPSQKPAGCAPSLKTGGPGGQMLEEQDTCVA